MTLPYGATVLEHFRRPRNHHPLERPTVSREGYNPLCGDRVRIELEIADGAVRSAAFTANACAICTASASLLTESVSGLSVSRVHEFTDEEIVAALGTQLPAGRLLCATLPLRTLREALAGLTPAA
ncbi:MAG: iron-sulfur cluster assembly scaffold protein [Gemmatimonadaceae bacterium]